MSDFLSNLARRGAGLAAVVQPGATPYFAIDPRAARSEGAPVEETTEMPASGETASTQTPPVEGPGPQYPGQPSPSRSRADVVIAPDGDPGPDYLARPEPGSESSADPQRPTEPAPPPVGLRPEETTPSRVGPPAPIRVGPRIQEVSWEAVVQSDVPAPGLPPPGRSPGSRTLPPAWEPSRASAPSGKSDLGQAAPQPILVRIGTVEVRAIAPPATPPPAPQSARGTGGFGDYAMIRSYRGWERV